MSGAVAIALHQCRNLSCARGYPLVIIARVEFGSKMLGESSRLECSSAEPFNIGFNTVLNCSDPQTLEEMAQYPLLVTLLEVLPKDKKAKEEKMQVLGQACIDLLPLLMGEVSLQLTQPLAPEQESSGQREIEIDIKLSVSQPLLQEKFLNQSNIFTLGVRSLYSLPDSWQPSSSTPYTVTLATPIPASLQKFRSLLVPNGHPKLPSEQESDQWRWPSLPNVVGKASLIAGGAVEQLAIEDENGDLNTNKDIKFRRAAECNKPLVTWNTRHRCWLPPDASSFFLQELSKCPLWPVEMGRFSSTGGTKGKTKEEEVAMSFHGVTYVNLAPLLYPGATKISGAYLLQAYNEGDINQKLQRTHTTLLEPMARSPTSLGKKAPGKRAPSSSRITESSSAVEELSIEPAEAKAESHAYHEARTYVHLEITLHRPLVPKRPASALAEKISEYIPPRPALPKRVGGADKAIQEFHDQTANIADLLLQEYRDLFGEELTNGKWSNNKEAADNRRHRLLYQLNSSGKYYSFKEQLKLSVVKIVREKFLNQAKTGDRNQQQAFLSQLYVFLTDEMHAGLGKVFSLGDQLPPPPSILTSDMLRHFATEAEALEDFKMADYYYKERLSRADYIASYWYDYGVFCLLTSDLDKSHQCFKEALSLDQRMVPVLLMYGMMCSLDGRHSEGESFFDMATTIDPTNTIAWTMRGLFYEHSNNPTYRDMAYKEAIKLNGGEQEKTYISHGNRSMGAQSKTLLTAKQPPHMGVVQHPSPAGTVTSGTEGNQQGLVQKSKLLGAAEGSSTRLQDYAAAPLTTSKVHNPPGEITVETPNGSQQEQYKVASSSTNLHETGSIASEDKGKPLAAGTGDTGGGQPTEGVVAPGGQPKGEGSRSTHKLGSLSGTSLDQKVGGEWKDDGENKECVEQPVSIFLQTATYLLDVHALKFAEMCLGHELTSPNGGPSAHYQIAVARLYMHHHNYTMAIECLRNAIVLDIQVQEYTKSIIIGRLDEAEDALGEANILNNLDPVVWAYLALVCLKTSRQVEAEQSLKYAIKVGLNDTVLLDEINALQKKGLITAQ
eukprot:Em0028g27a